MPTIAGFISFIQQVMGINATYLPTNAPVITMAFNVAMSIVNPDLAAIDETIYALAVYNLAGDNLLNYAPDQSGQTFFVDTRKSLGMTSFVAGVISGSGDETTSETILTPDFLKGLTMGNLQNLKSSYGRQYLAFAQDYGQLWGLS